MNSDIPQPLLSALVPHLDLVDELYQRYQADPTAVDPSWHALLSGRGAPVLAPSPEEAPAANQGGDSSLLHRVHALVYAYRARGHLEADLDPLRSHLRERHPDLDPATYGLSDADMDVLVPPEVMFGLSQPTPLGEVLRRLRAVYQGTVGIEFMHIADPVRRAFMAQRMETTANRFRGDDVAQVAIFEHLVAAESLERFIHTKYVGTKRFSIEGGETLIPLLHVMLQQAGEAGIDEAVLGMAHRGRLNVLTNLIGKAPSQLFAEFEDLDPETVLGGGDVKYHMGYSSDYVTAGGHKIHLSLAFNPSHLEAVDPVVVGRVRAKQRRLHDDLHERVLGVLIHGDAAFAGQGLVAETLNLSNLHGYRTGGTLHIVVNNQIGFTTAPAASRSTPYCTDVAKMIQVPIFHVNGDDPEAVAYVVEQAMICRRQFRCDVVIDMLCFRKYGHNESDEPSFTQPLLYQRIDRHPSVRQSYGESLIRRGVLSAAQADEIIAQRHQKLEHELQATKKNGKRPTIASLKGHWDGYRGGGDDSVDDVDTGISEARLAELTEHLSRVPEGFTAHPKIVRLLQQRGAMGRGEQPLDWGMGEALGLASLVQEGRLVRVSGQDSRRGTFSHRHAVVIDIKTGKEFTPIERVGEAAGKGGRFRIYDSMLSEAAVLGFEYGYSLDYPDGLVIWEAQFGDFVNGAQVILDQFVSSAEDKWSRLSGLVLLLPHGYEGQGPEHSSARVERFLQLCAEDNMQVVYPTTPAQLFHLLRRQVLRPWRKPLIIMSPKSLLRHPAAGSPVAALQSGRFQAVIPDDPAYAEAHRVFLCAGKVYYDLVEERQRRGDKGTAILRLEQLYPLRGAVLKQVLAGYPKAQELCWVQEEPANMGAQSFLLPRLLGLVGDLRLRAVARKESASPATGSHKAHVIEQRRLLEEAFGKPAS